MHFLTFLCRWHYWLRKRNLQGNSKIKPSDKTKSVSGRKYRGRLREFTIIISVISLEVQIFTTKDVQVRGTQGERDFWTNLKRKSWVYESFGHKSVENIENLLDRVFMGDGYFHHAFKCLECVTIRNCNSSGMKFKMKAQSNQSCLDDLELPRSGRHFCNLLLPNLLSSSESRMRDERD